jgi:hypothetical protein
MHYPPLNGALCFKENSLALLDFRAICLPYCLQQQSDGSYVALNREYKPLGFNTTDSINYKDFPVATSYKGIGVALAKKLSWKGDESLEHIYLYNDGTNPLNSDSDMSIYLKKLSLLAKLKIKT